MVEPTMILGGITFIFKLLTLCASLYSSSKVTTAFGRDWMTAKRRLDIQHAKLSTLYRERVCWFQNHESLLNENSELSQAISQQFGVIINHFKQCKALVDKYEGEQKKKDAELSRISSLSPEGSSSKDNLPASDGDGDAQSAGSPLIKKEKRFAFGKMFRRSPKQKKDPTQPEDDERPPGDAIVRPPLAVTPSESRIGKDSGVGTPSMSSASAKTTAISSDELTSRMNRELEKMSHQDVLAYKNSTWWQRVKWADHDRTEFYNQVDSIEKAIVQLESLLQLHGPIDPSDILGPVDAEALARQRKNTASARDALAGLHEALVASRSGQGQQQQQQLCFSVRVTEDPVALAVQLGESQDHLPVAPGCSFLTVLFARTSSRPGDPSAWLYANTSLKTNDGGKSGSSNRIPNLFAVVDDMLKSREPMTPHYQDLGYIASGKSPHDRHSIYCYNDGSPWMARKSLHDVISDPAFRSHFTVPQRAQVSRLMTICLLHLSNHIASTRQYPRLDKILYYDQGEEDDPWIGPWTEDRESPVLTPYVDISFGRRSEISSRPIGSSSGLSRPVINPVLELGLVLFQVAGGTPLQYGTSVEEVLRAVREALRGLSKLDFDCGPVFAEVVQLCLDKSKHVLRPMGDDDDKFVERVRNWLFNRELAAQ